MFKRLFLSVLLASAALCLSAQDKEQQCKAITVKGYQCMRTAKDNGYCSQHNPDKERCKATTSKGERCKNKASEKYNGKCHVHKFAKD